ncbi:hypothetical protein SYNPS1DRAFT_29100 [Syncephalis pseudoplumigaleata]|uniref:Uncharacterized protein n=1 Tax=Syncephalis pseudoplumigaleata TaxID=1712513 RepID=A0A4P9YYC3_9FUNG|nr:hypothetical protein SYNPS1DRAFT_29100 [Syncephalis pseudoplumigaleata]|eukprot:RKP25153.1 hypothetical protein SYNPS1DRAFT_29100 [Syncephalis pseudoplumigaleata]
MSMTRRTRSGRFERLMSIDQGSSRPSGRGGAHHGKPTPEDSGDTTAVTIDHHHHKTPSQSLSSRRHHARANDAKGEAIMLDDLTPQATRTTTSSRGDGSAGMSRDPSSNASNPARSDRMPANQGSTSRRTHHQHHDSNTGSVRSRNRYGSHGHARKSIDQGRMAHPPYSSQSHPSPMPPPPHSPAGRATPYPDSLDHRRREPSLDDEHDDAARDHHRRPLPYASVASTSPRRHTRSPSLPDHFIGNAEPSTYNTSMSGMTPPPPPPPPPASHHRRQRSDDWRASRQWYDADPYAYPGPDYRYAPPPLRPSDDRPYPYGDRDDDDYRRRQHYYEQAYAYRHHHHHHPQRPASGEDEHDAYYRPRYYRSSPSSPTMEARPHRYAHPGPYDGRRAAAEAEAEAEERAAYEEYHKYWEARRRYDDYIKRLERYHEELAMYEEAQRRHSRSLAATTLPEPPAPLSPPIAPTTRPPHDRAYYRHDDYRAPPAASPIYPPTRRLRSDWRREHEDGEEGDDAAGASRSPAAQRTSYEEPRTPPGIVRRLTDRWERATSPEREATGQGWRRVRGTPMHEADASQVAAEEEVEEEEEEEHATYCHRYQQQQPSIAYTPATATMPMEHSAAGSPIAAVHAHEYSVQARLAATGSPQHRASLTDDTSSSYYAQSLEPSPSQTHLPSMAVAHDAMEAAEDRRREGAHRRHSPELSSIDGSDPDKTPTFTMQFNEQSNHNDISVLSLQPPVLLRERQPSGTLDVPRFDRRRDTPSRQSTTSQPSISGQHGGGSIYYAESLVNHLEDEEEDVVEDAMHASMATGQAAHPMEGGNSLSNSVTDSITGVQYALSTDMEMDNYSIDTHLAESVS